VIRRWKRAEGFDVTYTSYHLAVDDGHSDEALAWSVRGGQYTVVQI
jgi:hypothetical protein